MKKIILFVLFFTLVCQIVYGGNGPGPIKLEVLYSGNFDTFYASSFDPDHPENHPLIFIVKITNTSSDTSGCKIALAISSDKYPEILSKEDGTIQSYDVYPFNSDVPDFLLLGPGDCRTISNRDIVNSDIEINGNWDDILQNNSELKEQVLNSGMLPAGTYNFTLYALDPNDASNIYDEEIIAIDVSNPGSLTLISPGEPFSSNPPEVVGNLPIFSWFSTINQFTLELFEVETGESIDDIINKEPYFKRDNISHNIFMYPADAPVLQENHIYAWKVIGITHSTQGENRVESGLWNFRVAKSEGVNPNVSNINNFIEKLENLGVISSDQFSIGDFTLTENAYQNGKLITTEDLLQLLNDILNGKYEVDRIEIE